jgi:hypothetical protein
VIQLGIKENCVDKLSCMILGTILQSQGMGATIAEICNNNYFILGGDVLAFQVIEGYSCLDQVHLTLVILSNPKNANDPTWLCLVLIPVFHSLNWIVCERVSKFLPSSARWWVWVIYQPK